MDSLVARRAQCLVDKVRCQLLLLFIIADNHNSGVIDSSLRWGIGCGYDNADLMCPIIFVVSDNQVVTGKSCLLQENFPLRLGLLRAPLARLLLPAPPAWQDTKSEAHEKAFRSSDLEKH